MDLTAEKCWYQKLKSRSTPLVRAIVKYQIVSLKKRPSFLNGHSFTAEGVVL